MQNKQCHSEFLAAEMNISVLSVLAAATKARKPEAKLSDTHRHEKSDTLSFKKTSKD